MWNNKINDISPQEISYGSKKKFWFNCPRGLHNPIEISLEQIILRKKTICKKCNSFAQYGIDLYGDNFLEKHWDYNKNTENPWKISYSSRKMIYIICQDNTMHGSYLIMCNVFVNTTLKGCPMCNVRGINGKPHKVDSLGVVLPKSIDVWCEQNKLSPFDVTKKSHKVVFWNCNNEVHIPYKRKISDSVASDFRCPSCMGEMNSSLLQVGVKEYFENFGYTVLHEYNCNLIAKSDKICSNPYLPYDNEILELKLIVEVHGSQHYSYSTWHLLTAERNGTTPEYELLQQQKRDIFKKQYAIENGYNYLEVPYWTQENDIYKDLIDNKIIEINTHRIRNDHRLIGDN